MRAVQTIAPVCSSQYSVFVTVQCVFVTVRCVFVTVQCVFVTVRCVFDADVGSTCLLFRSLQSSPCSTPPPPKRQRPMTRTKVKATATVKVHVHSPMSGKLPYHCAVIYFCATSRCVCCFIRGKYTVRFSPHGMFPMWHHSYMHAVYT